MFKYLTNLDYFTPQRNLLQQEYSSIPDFLLSIWNVIKSVVKFIIFAFVIFYQTCFAISKPVSQSMTPTCETHDVLVSSTLVYGIKLSNYIASLPIPGISDFIKDIKILQYPLFRYTKPRLGDIILFKTDYDSESTYCKRIIGCPGDKIQFIGGILFINDKPVQLKYLKKYSFIQNDETRTGDLYEETLPNGMKYKALYYNGLGGGSGDYTEPVIVPAGYYFGVGDNRHDSFDCRLGLCLVKESNIVGRCIVILISNGNITTLNFKNIKGIKWSKCLTWMI